LFAILDAVRARPIRHVMINTNGLRLAREPDFVARIAERKRGLRSRGRAGVIVTGRSASLLAASDPV
jgi:uncharacterized radical SAM superfamily Fe-S cluster-containing enzyme